jgi:superfamily II DNA or RNA helicase
VFEQFAASLRSMSRGENARGFTARPGQSRLIDWLIDHVESALRLCVRWPGGYGKTLGIALAYMILRQSGRVNRLIVVVANDQQRSQFRRDFPRTCRHIGLAIKGDCVWEFDKTARAYRTSMLNRCEVFVVTIQMVSATNKKSTDSLLDLVSDGNRWMLAADEYHHYAQEKDWGKSLQRICDSVVFSLAMFEVSAASGIVPFAMLFPRMVGALVPKLMV